MRKPILLLLAALCLWSCGGADGVASSNAPAPVPTSSVVETAEVQLRLDFSADPLNPSVVSYRISVTDEDGFVDLVPERVQARAGDQQELSLGAIRLGPIRVVVEGLDDQGNVLPSCKRSS